MWGTPKQDGGGCGTHLWPPYRKWAPSASPCPQGEPIWGPTCNMDATRKVLGMLRNAPLPPTLLNLQRGLIFDTPPLPGAHHSPAAVLSAWAAEAGGALQPLGEEHTHCRASAAALGWPEPGAGSCQAPSPAHGEGMRWGASQAGLGGQSSMGMGKTSPPHPHPTAGSTTAGC